ncbi:MAG: HAMP domain-containing histidine kinase [Clostridia bacterium]|nr:HAMP domain-containing histidine kinase [Clostridia bacterium]
MLFFIGTYYYGQHLFDFYLDNWNDYGIWNLQASKTVFSNGTSEYAEKIRTETDNAITLATEYKNDEYVKSGEGWAKREAEIIDYYEDLYTYDVLSEARDWVEGEYYYDEDREVYQYPNFDNQKLIIKFSSENQIKADEKPISIGGNEIYGLTKRGENYYYKGFPLAYANIDRDAIKEENDVAMRQQIATEKSDYKAKYKRIKKELASLDNYKYFIVNKNTNQVYTNMDGVDTAGQAKTKYNSDTEYFASVIDGDFETGALLADTFMHGNDITTWYYDDKGNIQYVYDEVGKFSYCFESLDPQQYDIVVYANVTKVSANPGDDFTKIFNDWQTKNENLDQNITIFVISFVSLILCFVLLAATAGERQEDGKIKYTILDKVPNSIHFIFSFAFAIAFVFVPIFFYYRQAMNRSFTPNLSMTLISAPAVLIFDEWLMSTARQVKNRHFWKNTLIYILIISNWGKFKTWINSGLETISHKDIKKNIFTAFVVYVVLMACFSVIPVIGTIADILLSVVAFLYVRKLSTGLDSISSALTKAEKGDYDFSVDVEAMPFALKAMGESVNDLTSGINIAVDKATKSERMKTELITNVSHDLKTPLTSIITYTNLLKECDIEDATANEYINVLDEKSQRLKQLVEDLVEAAKASSGNVTLNIVTINLNELTQQVFGEYEDTLSQENLELKLNLPDEPIYVNVDGQKTYRIIENLFSNVKKYAMPNTRVFLDVKESDGFALLSMKNVSKDEMNFDVERLTDRFVRGDEARNSDGSGLGLSIAKSLTELQGGRFDISVDGDLFKVTIALPVKE